MTKKQGDDGDAHIRQLQGVNQSFPPFEFAGAYGLKQLCGRIARTTALDAAAWTGADMFLRT